MRRGCFDVCVCVCVCVSICETDPSSGGPRPLFHLQHLLFFLELSADPPLSVCSAYLDATTSVVSAGSLWQLQNQSLLVLIQSQRDLVSFLVCLLPSRRLCTDIFETIRSISWDLWCLIPPLYMGPPWKCGTPRPEIPWGLGKKERERVCEVPSQSFAYLWSSARNVIMNGYALFYYVNDGEGDRRCHIKAYWHQWHRREISRYTTMCSPYAQYNAINCIPTVLCNMLVHQ